MVASENRGRSPSDRRRRRPAPVVGAAILVGGAVYANALTNPFVYDDHREILDNLSLHDLTNIRAVVMHALNRPAINISYALDYSIWGNRPLGFHLTNLLFHLINVALVFALARTAARHSVTADQADTSGEGLRAGEQGVAQAVGLVAALMFAVHPMLTEAVGYVSGRSEVLCGTFFLLAFLSGLRWLERGGWHWGVPTIACWVLALASKETAIMLPAVLVAYDLLLLPHGYAERRGRFLGVHTPLVLLSLIVGAARVAVLVLLEHPGDTALNWRFGLIELEVISRYLVLFALPRGQTVFHVIDPIQTLWSPRALMAIAVVVGIAVTIWRARRSAPAASFGLVWFVLLLVPAAALVMVDRGEAMAEHRTYIASCGLFLAAASIAGTLDAAAARISPRVRRIGRLAGVALIIWLGAHAALRNAVWHSPVALWVEAAEAAPDHWWPRLVLAEALHDAGRRQEAVVQYRAAIERRPEEGIGYAKLAQSLAELDRFNEATAVLETLRERDGGSAFALNALGAVAAMAGDTTRAQEYFSAALIRDRNNLPARQGLANIAEADNPAEALRLCQELRQLAPEIVASDECIRRNRARLETGHSTTR